MLYFDQLRLNFNLILARRIDIWNILSGSCRSMWPLWRLWSLVWKQWMDFKAALWRLSTLWPQKESVVSSPPQTKHQAPRGPALNKLFSSSGIHFHPPSKDVIFVPEPRPRWGDRSLCYSWRPSPYWFCRRWTLSFRTPSMLWSRKTSTFTTSWRTWPMPSKSSKGCCGTAQMVLSYIVSSRLNNQCDVYWAPWLYREFKKCENVLRII